MIPNSLSCVKLYDFTNYMKIKFFYNIITIFLIQKPAEIRFSADFFTVKPGFWNCTGRIYAQREFGIRAIRAGD